MKADLFQNKYRRQTLRLKDYDYSTDGFYFITICTKEKMHYFGMVDDDKTKLFEMGKIAQKFWSEIPQHFPFVILDQYIVMPNHVHGIISINKQAAA